MGKVGGDGISAKKQPFADIAKTLLDFEDRLPPNGVLTDSKKWWNGWRTRVTNAGNSGNFKGLQNAAVEIALEMKQDVSTSWWQSQNMIWRTHVRSSTTDSALSLHLNELLSKAVDWSAARRLFSLESPDSERKEKAVEDSGHLLVMDRSGVDDKGTPSRATRLQVVAEKEKKSSQVGWKEDEDSRVQKSTPNSALRRSKRKRCSGDDEEVLHVDSPGSENPTITENSLSIAKKKRGEEADEGPLSHPNNLDNAQSETDTTEGQSSVDETKINLDTRKIDSIVESEQELGTEEGELNSIDRKTLIGYTRSRTSRRCLVAVPDCCEDGQTSETIGSGEKVESLSAEPLLEAGNAMVLYEQEVFQLTDTTVSVLSPRRGLRSSGLKNELGKADLSKVSPHQESSPTQGCPRIEDGPQELNQDSDVKIPRPRGRPRKIQTSELGIEDNGNGKEIPRQRGRPRKIKTSELEKVDDGDGKEIARPRGRPRKIKIGELEKEDDGDAKEIARPRGRPRKIQTSELEKVDGDGKEIPRPRGRPRKIQTSELEKEDDGDAKEIPRPRGRPRKIQTSELEKDDDGGGKEQSRNCHESSEISSVKDLCLSAQDSNLVTLEAIDNLVETRNGNAGHTDEPGQEDDGGGKKESIESPGISTAKDICRSVEDSNLVTLEAIDTRVETRLENAGHTGEPGQENDAGGKRKSTESPGISTAKNVCLSAQDSNLVTLKAIDTQVEKRLGNAGHTDEPGQEEDGGGKQKSTESPGISTAKDICLSLQDSNLVTLEAIDTRVEMRLGNAGHTDEPGQEDDAGGKQKSTESSGISTAKDVCRSVQDSNLVTLEAIDTRVETRLGSAGHTDEPGKEDDGGGKQKSTESPGISTARDVCLSVQDSNLVTLEANDNRVETRLGNAGHTDEPGKEDGVGGKQKSTESPGISTVKDVGLPAQDFNVMASELMVIGVETDLQKAEHAGELEKEDEQGENTAEHPGITTANSLSLSKPDSNFVTSKEMFIWVETSLQNARPIADETGCSGAIVGRIRRNIRRPKKYDSADIETPRSQKAQSEGKQGRIGTRGKGKQMNSSNDSYDTRAGKENRNDRAAGNSSGQKALQVGEGRDGAGPDKSESSIIDVTPQRRRRLIRKASEAKLNESQGGQKPDSSYRSPQQEMDIGQVRHTASSVKLESLRVRKSRARQEGKNERGTDESSGEEEHENAVRNYKLGKGSSRKRQRSPSSDSSYEETTSSSQGHSEEEFKVGGDTEDAEETDNMDLDNVWGQKLPEDFDPDDYFATHSEELGGLLPVQLTPSLEAPVAGQDLMLLPPSLEPPVAGQDSMPLVPSLEPPVADQDSIVADAECAVCSFAGSDELMLLCDKSGCTCAIHTFCLTPPLEAIPEGEWLCPHCTRLKDLKDSHSDTKRLPKTCSKYPAKSLGSLIGRRMEPLQKDEKIQYLVKWDSLSHEHDTWVPEDWIHFMHPRQLLNFNKKHPLADSVFNVDERELEWLVVDRIIACRKQGSKTPVRPSQVSYLLQSRQQQSTGYEFLVKWQALDYKSATWEKEQDTEGFQQAISSYVKRHKTAERSGSTKEEMNPVANIMLQPDYLCGGTMFGFQMHGLKWLLRNFEQGRNVILADEMGLGKTVQTLAFISCVRYEGLSSRPALVIAPKSTLSAWEQEFRTWVPGLNVVLYQGDKENRNLIRQHEFITLKEPLFEVLLTSYDFAASDTSVLSKYRWASLTVDEGHRVKNVQSHLSAQLKVPTADFRLLLTGTPLQNKLEELFTLLNFLDPEEFPDPVKSAKQFMEVDAQGNKAQSDGTLLEQLSRLKELLKPRMLRRMKKEVLSDLIPGRKAVTVSCGLTSLQRDLYTAVLTKNFEVLNRGVKKGLKRNLQMIVTDLRMVSDHAYLIPGKELPQVEPVDVYTNMVEGSGKFQLLEKLLPRLKEQGHRVLLFSQFTAMLDILEDFMGFLGLSYSRLDGKCSSSSRQKSIEEFNAENSKTFIFLISTRAGGLGLNLASADTVIIYDPDFNPFVDLQAQARAHRIGQDKTVLVYQLITKFSVEEKILERARKKLAMENLVMNEESKETAASITTLLLHGARTVLDKQSMKDTSIKWTDESMTRLLDRDLLTSTDDEPTAHGYLGTVQGDGFFAPVFNNEEDQKPKGGDSSEWHELLHRFEVPKKEEELGRGKRVRKQVKYAVEGGLGEGHEEEEYNPSSHDTENSSDTDVSMDSEVMSRTYHRKTADQVVGGVPFGEYAGICGISNSSHTLGTPSHSFPGEATIMNLGLHVSMLSGISQQVMGSSANMVHPPTSLTPHASPSLATMGSFKGPGSTSQAFLPGKSRVAGTSSRAGVSRVPGAPPQLRPIMSKDPTMSGGPSRFGHMSAETMALQSRTLMSGTGLTNTQFVNPPMPFPGVYPFANSNNNSYAAPSYPGNPVPGPPYMHYAVPPPPIQQLPSQFLFNDGRANPQSLNTQNPSWDSFSELQQAAQFWSMPSTEQRSTPAVSRMAWSDKGGSYRHSGQHGSTGGVLQLPPMPSPLFQSPPPSVQSRSRTAAHHQSSVKNKRGSSSNIPSAAAAPAAPWLAGYCTVSTPLSPQVEPQVISASRLAPVPISPVQGSLSSVMSGVPQIPQLYSALDLHDPTALQVSPMSINMFPSGRVPEPVVVQASAVNSLPSPPAPNFAPPHVDLRPISSLDRNSSSCLPSQPQASVMTLPPHVGAMDTVTTLPMPQTFAQPLQFPTLLRTFGVPTSETRVDRMFIGGGSTGQCQPALAAMGEQIVNGGGSSHLSVQQLEGIDPPSTSKQLPAQSKKPLWIPKGDAGMLMGPLLTSPSIKVEDGS